MNGMSSVGFIVVGSGVRSSDEEQLNSGLVVLLVVVGDRWRGRKVRGAGMGE